MAEEIHALSCDKDQLYCFSLAFLSFSRVDGLYPSIDPCRDISVSGAGLLPQFESGFLQNPREECFDAEGTGCGYRVAGGTVGPQGQGNWEIGPGGRQEYRQIEGKEARGVEDVDRGCELPGHILGALFQRAGQKRRGVVDGQTSGFDSAVVAVRGRLFSGGGDHEASESFGAVAGGVR